MVPRVKQQKYSGSLPLLSPLTFKKRACEEYVLNSQHCVCRKRAEGGIPEIGLENNHFQ